MSYVGVLGSVKSPRSNGHSSWCQIIEGEVGKLVLGGGVLVLITLGRARVGICG